MSSYHIKYLKSWLKKMLHVLKNLNIIAKFKYKCLSTNQTFQRFYGHYVVMHICFIMRARQIWPGNPAFKFQNISLADKETDGWKETISEPPEWNVLTFNQLSVALHSPRCLIGNCLKANIGGFMVTYMEYYREERASGFRVFNPPSLCNQH